MLNWQEKKRLEKPRRTKKKLDKYAKKLLEALNLSLGGKCPLRSGKGIEAGCGGQKRTRDKCKLLKVRRMMVNINPKQKRGDKR
jgi:hypothetical protein